ncbi:MAG: htrA [Hyphomicrobiales bacterium]|nr:htrA [Hyphomicrobiales bacterium]
MSFKVHQTGQAPRPLRKAFLGAAAAVVIGGSLGAAVLMPPGAVQAQTATAPQVRTQAPVVTIPGTVPSFADVIDRVKGAVVSVRVRVAETGDAETTGMPGMQPGDPLERFFRRFGDEDGMQGQRRARPRTSMAQGSGFIISADGYVVTNNHVVKNAEEVILGLDDGRSVSAKVVGTDEKTDLALLKINEAGDYPVTEWAEGTPRIGDWVLAVGNPFGLGGTVTAGIVSARGRDIGAGPYDDFLQIDAPVNRGNSGGPTFDLHGRVVGVNTAIYSPSGGSVGIGFAIPANVARDVIVALKDHGKVERGYIGVQIQAITPEIADSLQLKSNKGALVADTQPDTPAAKAGVKSGDVIVAVNGERIDTARDLSRKIAALGPQKNVELTYLRNGREATATVTLGALPEQSANARGGRDRDRDRFGSDDADRSGPRLGLRLAPGSGGVRVMAVEPDSPAAAQGLREGDVILEVAGKPVSRPADVADAVRTARQGDRKTVLMRVKSGEGTRFVAMPTNRAS